jgi:hypothetical protein
MTVLEGRSGFIGSGFALGICGGGGLAVDSRYTGGWQEDRAVAAGIRLPRMPGEESPNSAGQCAG